MTLIIIFIYPFSVFIKSSMIMKIIFNYLLTEQPIRFMIRLSLIMIITKTIRRLHTDERI
ncbi:hypothetical protein CVD19_20220 [Bacillus sp. T33-2]|nr:hypothetical protein CVD19_20220 [Bacillus sp. T33-2]